MSTSNSTSSTLYERGLTTPRSPSRPSSRSSIRSSGRAPSPSVSDDPVAVRNQVSTLKHTIRHQQAQLQSLENMLLRGPRPYPPELSSPDPSTPIPIPIPSSPPSSANGAVKIARRSSYDVLHGIAPDSSIPLPRRERESAPLEDFQEGVPMSFPSPSSPPSYKRNTGSPTRTLSRIPVSSVGNARALADEGQPATHRPTKTLSIDTEALSPSSSALQIPAPPSPNRRVSLTPGGTTKVLADLQTGVVNARNALENTKAQLRLAQRSVAQLTRQTEDLKEGRERLRLENEGLNNVVARKERLLQEVLERARKAEAEAAALKTQLKTETTVSKKSLREMETALAESTALSQKSEREYITLRDSIKGLVEGFKGDTVRLKEEMTKREERWRAEAEGVGKKYRLLLQEIEAAGEGRKEVQKAREEEREAARKVEAAWAEEIAQLKGEVERSGQESAESGETARQLAAELARLRRLMQNVSRLSSDMDPP
ncbi:hypothetical protein DFH07DRAFT_792010 [Mycena maculata]|uniref:SWI5-dependent HO expression protein 3 n=1 Tax=Mycena maculata TaxID=230809 RepID=A0AAD7NZY3_9AGAR|nr:hypothetical protein DFH07DRAFT_792010 [Mycena maculata]